MNYGPPSRQPLPLAQVSQFAPMQYESIRRGEMAATPDEIIGARIREVLDPYTRACREA